MASPAVYFHIPFVGHSSIARQIAIYRAVEKTLVGATIGRPLAAMSRPKASPLAPSL